SSTFVLLMAKQPTQVETISNKYTFNQDSLNEYVGVLQQKRIQRTRDMQPLGPAFDNDLWQQARQKYRYIITRCSAHGFHHLVCTRRHCYTPSNCSCKICGATNIHRQHILECPRNNQSLSEFVRDRENT